MKIFKSLKEWRATRQQLTGEIGFVPTMGALHAGHAALLKRSRRENAISVLSIFVNPTQFNDKNDYDKYPNTFAADVRLAEESGVDYILYPEASDIYRDDYRFKMSENQLSHILEGEFRPGHFDGVLTVVLKLFHLIEPTRAYFGEKDFQQLKLIEAMVQALFMPLQVVACETLREADGLAMSSRNVRLSPQAREKAPLIAKYLFSNLSNDEVKVKLSDAGFEVEYIAHELGRRLCAAKIEGVRLIDNVKI